MSHTITNKSNIKLGIIRTLFIYGFILLLIGICRTIYTQFKLDSRIIRSSAADLDNLYNITPYTPNLGCYTSSLRPNATVVAMLNEAKMLNKINETVVDKMLNKINETVVDMLNETKMLNETVVTFNESQVLP